VQFSDEVAIDQSLLLLLKERAIMKLEMLEVAVENFSSGKYQYYFSEAVKFKRASKSAQEQ
jgi:hypothetical protein